MKPPRLPVNRLGSKKNIPLRIGGSRKGRKECQMSGYGQITSWLLS